MKALNLVIVGSLIAMCSAVGFSAVPTKESLLSGWEEIQKGNHDTVLFEKKSENLYRFKTNIFPYDGEIRILNLVIKDRPVPIQYSNGLPSISGVVELELTSFTDEMKSKYRDSYSVWAENNTLFFDEKGNRWITSKEYGKMVYTYTQKKIAASPDYYQYIMILALLIIIFVLPRRHDKKIDSAAQRAEEAISLHKETNKLLQQVLDEMKNNPRA